MSMANETAASTGIVHVVDDDASLRNALRLLLGAAGFEVRLHASALDFLMAMNAASDACACVILDVRMPGANGLDIHEGLLRQRGALPVIFLTGHGDIPMTVRAMKSGAVDFLTKPVKREALLAAVRAALARNAAWRAAQADLEDLRARHATLKPRELEVFGHVVAGRLNKQISADIGAAERTVKAHRAAMMEKMNVTSVADLVRVAEKLREAGISTAAPVPPG